MTAAHIRGGITPVLLFFLFLNAAALAVGPAAVQVDRDPRRRLAFRGDGIEDCFRPIVLCRLPTLCGGNDALGLDPYQAPAEHRVPVRRAFLRYGCARRLVFSGRDAFDTGLDRRSHGCRWCGARRQFSWRKVLKPKIAPTANNAADSGQTRSHRSSDVFRRQAVSWRAKPDADHLE